MKLSRRGVLTTLSGLLALSFLRPKKSVAEESFTVSILRCDSPTETGRIYPTNVVQQAIVSAEKAYESLGGVPVTIHKRYKFDPGTGRIWIAEVDIAGLMQNLRIVDGVLIGDVRSYGPQGHLLQSLLDDTKWNTKIGFRTVGAVQLAETGTVRHFRLIGISTLPSGKFIPI